MTNENASCLSTTLIALISEGQQRLNMTDEQMSKALGFERTNVIPMIKAGTIKLPIDKVPALAKAIDYPAADVLRVALHDYMPDVLAAIEKIWAPIDMTANERKLIESYRYLAKGRDVVPLVMDGQSIIALVAA